MRALKLILTAVVAVVAVAAGLFAAAVVALIGLTIFAINRLLGQKPKPLQRPVFGRRPPRREPTDAIEVTATEVGSADRDRLPEDSSGR